MACDTYRGRDGRRAADALQGPENEQLICASGKAARESENAHPCAPNDEDELSPIEIRESPAEEEETALSKIGHEIGGV